jgi:hypothetical protein
MKYLFQEDPSRFDKFTGTFEETLVDFSKNRVTDERRDYGFAVQDVKGKANSRHVKRSTRRKAARTTPIVLVVLPAVNDTLQRMIKALRKKSAPVSGRE